MESEEELFKEWAGLLIIQDRRLLVLKESDKPFFFLPGGKVEHGESNKQTAVRECIEELGITVTNLVQYTDIFEPSWSNDELYRYRCFLADADLPDLDNLPGKTDEVRWIHSKSNIKLGTIPQKALVKLQEEDLVD